MNCPLCIHELEQVGGDEGTPFELLSCKNHGGCTASPETWEMMRVMKASAYAQGWKECGKKVMEQLK